MDVLARNTYLTRRRWLVLSATCIANLCIGAMFTWSVFAGPMAEHFNTINGTNLTAADMSKVFSFASAISPFAMITGGFFESRWGSRRIILWGTVIFGLGFVICGFAKSMLMLYIGFGIFTGLADGFAYACTIGNSIKFFPDKKGLVGGIITASYGISAVIIPPIANLINIRFGVCTAFVVVGAAIMTVGALCSIFIINCPEDFRPDGWLEQSGGESLSTVQDKNASQMLRTPLFYVMLSMLFVGCTLGLMMISDASSIAQSMIGMSASAAAVVVSALALFNTAGRIVAGWLSDRIGRINTLTVVYVSSVAALLLMYLSGENQNAAMLTAGICLIGLGYGSFMGVYPGFTSDQFGMKYSASNYGIMFMGFSAGGVVGPMITRTVFNAQGSYRQAFLISAALAVLGLGLSLLYRGVKKKS